MEMKYNPIQSAANAVMAPPGGRLHHVGFVVPAIANVVKGFAASLGGTWGEKIFADPNQRVRVTFLKGPGATDALVELIEPDGPDSPVLSFLKKGGGLHHLCYEVKSLESQLQFMRAIGGKIVRPPLPAVAFNGRRIAWVYTKYQLLLEFLEE
jgi:methylmalonyl-CoA/ethylmalonyl-CoA epimerase